MYLPLINSAVTPTTINKTKMTLFFTRTSQSKTIQKTQLAGQPGKPAGQNQPADGDQEYAADHLHRTQVPPEAAIENEKTVHHQRSKQEGHSQSERVNPEQKNALGHAVFIRRHAQNSRQHWSDAGSPAKCEGKAHEERSKRRLAARRGVDP